jgi:hypothetical protein
MTLDWKIYPEDRPTYQPWRSAFNQGRIVSNSSRDREFGATLRKIAQRQKPNGVCRLKGRN